MFDWDKLDDTLDGEQGILLTKFKTWADVDVGDVLAKKWSLNDLAPPGWTKNGGWIFYLHTGFTMGHIRPDIRARKV